MKPGFSDYLKAAFSARPIGMAVPPNWVAVGVFALLGVLNPGFWILGAGLEMGYLYALATNPRFQRTVAGAFLLQDQRQWQSKMESMIGTLSTGDRFRYRDMERRCRMILDQQKTGNSPSALAAQGEGLGRLLWVFLRLLLMRQAVNRVLNEATDPARESIEDRMAELQEQLKDPALDADLRKSVTGQLDILQQRIEKRKEARTKLAFLDSELTRIEQQAELIREQSVLTTDPDVVSQRVDQIAATLGGTAQWIQQQQKIYGQVEDLLTEPPPVPVETPMKEGPR